jgi:septal ring factor EnvC (AmiA/AmiB activator)
MARIRIRVAAAVGAALLLGAAPLGPTAASAQVYDASEAENAMWAEQLAEAQAEIEASRERLEQAQAKYVRARHDDYPRGEALAELEKEVEEARQALAEAEERLPELVEEARRAGVLPEVLRPYR